MKIAFLGCGNMARAMIGGMINSKLVKPEQIIATAKTEKTRKEATEQFGICIEENNQKAAVQGDIIFLAMKPQFYQLVIEEIREVVTARQIIVTIAPGWTLKRLEGIFQRSLKIVRTMPNTPALVGEGMTAICPNEQVEEKELEQIVKIMESFGKAAVITEAMFDGVIAVSGSSPAYIYMMIEAMADGAVREGLPRKQAYEFAAQAVLGSAKMVLETGKHPAELKDMVCSPAGTTIEAVRVLEEKGFRSSLMEAMKACTDKSRNI